MITQYNSICHNTTLPFSGQKTMGSETQFCFTDDGRKDARNMLRNNWLPINHYLLHLVGLAFICWHKCSLNLSGSFDFRPLWHTKQFSLLQAINRWTNRKIKNFKNARGNKITYQMHTLLLFSENIFFSSLLVCTYRWLSAPGPPEFQI